MTQLTIHHRGDGHRSQDAARQLLERVAALPTATISDALGRTGALHGLRPLGQPSISGPALTVLTAPGDNLAVHRAVDLARPGDVLVVDAGGFHTRAVIGEIVARYAASRGVAGMVIDGVVRDAAAIAALPMPVWCRGRSPLAPSHRGPGTIGCPVAFGGRAVRPDDLLVGDDDGLVVIPREQLLQVVGAAEGLLAEEPSRLAAADATELDRSWLDEVDERWVPSPPSEAGL